MTALFLMAAALVGFVLLAAMFQRHLAILLAVVGLVALWTEFGGVAGTPAMADARLSREPWIVLTIAQLGETQFLISVRYAGGDIRTYDLTITDQAEKDKFLKAQQRTRKGLRMLGKAKHPRAGQENDGGMDFEFHEAGETAPK